MRKVLLSLVLLPFLVGIAHADTFETVPHPSSVWDTTLGQLYSICVPGFNTCTLIASASGTQTFSNKTLASPAVTGNISLSATSFMTGSSADGIVAHSGGGGTSATQLTAQISRISTVAANHDSVKLPPSIGGIELAIDNDGASILDIYPNGSDTLEDGAGPISITPGSDVSIVSPVTGKWYLQAGNALTPIACGASCTLTSSNAGQTTLLNVASGSVATLPAATGTGNIYPFVVSVAVTSVKDAILAASSSDSLIGIAIGENGNTPKAFVGGATFHSFQMPFAGTQPSGGFLGDSFTCKDIAAGVWNCNGTYQSGVTPTTPYSTATN